MLLGCVGNAHSYESFPDANADTNKAFMLLPSLQERDCSDASQHGAVGDESERQRHGAVMVTIQLVWCSHGDDSMHGAVCVHVY